MLKGKNRERVGSARGGRGRFLARFSALLPLARRAESCRRCGRGTLPRQQRHARLHACGCVGSCRLLPFLAAAVGLCRECGGCLSLSAAVVPSGARGGSRPRVARSAPVGRCAPCFAAHGSARPRSRHRLAGLVSGLVCRSVRVGAGLSRSAPPQSRGSRSCEHRARLALPQSRCGSYALCGSWLAGFRGRVGVCLPSCACRGCVCVSSASGRARSAPPTTRRRARPRPPLLGLVGGSVLARAWLVSARSDLH